ncbi:hypothetical protein FIV42_20750 [Persicimonas caeni]|uniref:Exo-alpha-sialidase n=1 Tax=Persicimonas caeni TaxID=2292766 RepID=A0A4Y6PZB0_PERCE|nr:hypothetical protein [Persicimonas caeni]QDG53085.1 hypothetical protein FIV42_20750 [Persicimonas caeni]QED34307.1 hypothetical protein FRD00_20745 [Persicimonas caeni]
MLATAVCLSATSLLLNACSEDAVDGDWGIDENVTFEVEQLQGPPEEPGDYLGRIGDNLYFAGNNNLHLRPSNPATVYSAAARWHYAPAEVTAAARGDGGHREQIVEVDGEFFYLFEGGAVLYGTSDGGQTWQEMGDVPEVGGGRLLGDGEHLYVLESPVGGPSDASVLWRSDDRGETWQPILEAIQRDAVRAMPDLLVAAVAAESDWSGRLVRSTDAGATWEDLGSMRDLGSYIERFGAEEWVKFDGEWLTPPLKHPYDMDGHLGVVDDDGLVDYRPLAGLSETDSLETLTPCGDKLYATARDEPDNLDTPYGTRLGRIDTASDTWTELELPEETYIPLRLSGGGLHCVGGESLVVITDAGAWRSDDGAQTWQQVGSPFSTPTYLFRSDGDLYSGQSFSPTWKKPQDQSRWEHTTAFRELSDGLYEVSFEGVRDVHGSDGRLFVTVETDEGAAVYRTSGPQADPDEIWASPQTNILEVRVHVDGDHVAIAEHRLGSGLFVSHDGGDSLEQVDLPPTDYGIPAPNSVAFFDGRIWVAMPGFELWSKPIGDGDWRREERGLPETHRPDALRHAHGRLLAVSSRQVYRRVDGRWQGVLSDEIRHALDLPAIEAFGEFDDPDIHDATVFGGVLVVATDTKIALVRPDDSYDILDETGGVELFDLGTELYAAAPNGGLVRVAR